LPSFIQTGSAHYKQGLQIKKMKTELIEKLEALLQKEDISGIVSEVRTLQTNYEIALSQEAEKAREEHLSGGLAANDFVFQKQSEDLKIEELFRTYRELKKAHEKKVLLEQLRNQEVKHSIVEKIKALGNIQSQPGKAMKTLKDLQIQWNEAGSVSSHVYKDLQNEYSKAVEAFYYSLDIYKVLQEHDFKKNLELKTEIISRLEILGQHKSIKEIERLIKVYRDEWDEVGPVQNDKWEPLKAQWKSGLDLIYGKLKAHYAAVEELKEKNLIQKNLILEKATQLLTELPSNEDDWKKSTETIIALQKDWKSTGFSQKGKGEASWNAFRETCDKFFEARNIFLAQIKESRSGLRKQKNELIEKAEALSADTSWKETADKMIRLQADWKKIPSAGPHEEPRLFHRFRKACNAFFDARKKYFEDQDQAAASEVKTKEEFLTRLQSQEMTGDQASDKELLHRLRNEWMNGAPLPAKEKKRLNDQFYLLMDALYAKLNVNASELALIQYSNKLEKLQRDDTSGNLLQREFDSVKKQAEQIHLDILKYENNLGFFKVAKGDNPLLSEIHSKIASEKERLLEIKSRLKMAREALNKVVA
jgi:hypothetical protein